MNANPLTPRLAAALMVAAALLGAGCERRPRDPKPPSDPGRSIPKPVIEAVLPLPAAVIER